MGKSLSDVEKEMKREELRNLIQLSAVRSWKITAGGALQTTFGEPLSTAWWNNSVFCGVADHQLINHFRSCVAQLSGAGFLFGWTIAILHLLSSMDSTVTRQWISLVACLPTAVQHDDVNHLDLIPLQCRELYDHQKLQFVDPHPYLAESSKW